MMTAEELRQILLARLAKARDLLLTKYGSDPWAREEVEGLVKVFEEKIRTLARARDVTDILLLIMCLMNKYPEFTELFPDEDSLDDASRLLND